MHLFGSYQRVFVGLHHNLKNTEKMKNTSLIECYTADTTYLSDEAKMIVLDIITRIDTINQMAKNDVIIYADSQMVVERRILGEVTRWLALWDQDYNYHEGVHTPSDIRTFRKQSGWQGCDNLVNRVSV